MDTDLADVAVADKLVQRIKARYPKAKLGAELIFRGGQLRGLDAVLPKDVWLMNMVNWTGETAMSDFDKIQGRELIVWPRITDDGGELNIQVNAMMYDNDQTISAAGRYGVTGVLGQMNKARGTEPSASISPKVPGTRKSVASRSTSATWAGFTAWQSQAILMKAFMLLEENEKALGWREGTAHSAPTAGNRHGRRAAKRELQRSETEARSVGGGKGRPGGRSRGEVLGRPGGPVPAEALGADAASARAKVLPGSHGSWIT